MKLLLLLRTLGCDDCYMYEKPLGTMRGDYLTLILNFVRINFSFIQSLGFILLFGLQLIVN